MLRITILVSLTILCLAAAVAPSAAQTAEDQIRAVVQSALAAYETKDADAYGALLHENAIAMGSDPMGPRTREESIQGIATGTPTLGVTLGEYEPEVWGDVALAVVPAKAPTVPFEVRIAALLLREDDGWKITASGLVLPVDGVKQADPGAAEFADKVMAGLAPMRESFVAALMAGDRAALVDLYAAKGVAVAPRGADGSLEVVAAKDLKAAEGGDAPKLGTYLLGDESSAFSAVGLGLSVEAIDVTVTPAGGAPQESRGIVFFCYDAAAEAWKVMATAEAPLE